MPLTLAVALLAALGASCSRSSSRDAVRRVEANGVELHYVEEGQGTPVVLLHPGQGDYRSWPAQFRALRRTHRVIAYSRRYHYPNDNPISGDRHSALVEAEDLAAFISALGLGPVHLVGASYGALTALVFATAHPEMVRSLVLAEPPVFPWITSEPAGAALSQAFLSNVHEPAARAFAAGDATTAMRLLTDALEGPGTFDRLPDSNREAVLANAGFYRALTASSNPYPEVSREAARALTMPILLVKGEDTDPLHKLVTEEVGRVLTDARRVTVAWAGHGSPRQNPDSFNYAMLEFLGTVP
jgi:pimeloyl-ACP methyl ester carboxylesterase